MPSGAPGQLRGMAATGEPWSGLNVNVPHGWDGSTEKRKQELAALSTSSSCLARRVDQGTRKG